MLSTDIIYQTIQGKLLVYSSLDKVSLISHIKSYIILYRITWNLVDKFQFSTVCV